MTTSTSPATTPPLTYEQIHGALLGAAVGDALGWPYEYNAGRIKARSEPETPDTFMRWHRRQGGTFQPIELEIGPGEYSDDTQLILATARAVLWYTRWEQYLSRHELPLWLLYERGGGGASTRAARSWLQGKSPWSNDRLRPRYFDAGGNGAAMRVLPHLFVPNQTDAQLMRDVLRNGLLTHGHPHALVGAKLYALAGWWIAHHSRAPIAYGALIDAMLDQESLWAHAPEPPGSTDGKSQGWLEAANQHFPGGYLELWRQTVGEARDGLHRCKRALSEGALADDYAILDELGCFQKETNGSGVVAALATIYLFATHAANPMVGLRTIAQARKADTDTLASMLGGLYGLLHHVEWLPDNLRKVQDHQYLVELASAFSQLSKPTERTPEGGWREAEKRQIVGQLRRGEQAVTLGVLGELSVTACRQLRSFRDDQRAVEWRLEQIAGPTLFIVDVQQAKPAPASQVPSRTKFSESHSQGGRNETYEARALPLQAQEEAEPHRNQDETQEPGPSPLHDRVGVAGLLEAMATTLPLEVSAKEALRLAAEIVSTPSLTIGQLRALVEQLLPGLNSEQQGGVSAQIARQIGLSKA